MGMASDIIFANDESKESLEKVLKGKLLFGLFESNAAGELTLLADSSKFPLTEKATSRPAFRDFETIEKSGEAWGLIQDKIFEADNLKPVTILAFLTLDDNDLKKKSNVSRRVLRSELQCQHEGSLLRRGSEDQRQSECNGVHQTLQTGRT